ncbi:MAG: hypothetical protein DRQ57_12635 [Gammaproteobacteria bacterium]|nr:MAG: hypothetical protein DRQ57_12635 [Gammaproteobacteria bacterium]
MNIALLSLEQTPPLSVPLRFFLTAPLFGLLASLLLLYDGPHLLMNRWYPSTLALTHLITLGFITMVMFGAMLQLLPVLAGSPVPRPIFVSSTLHILLTLGTLSLASGFITGWAWMMVSALILLGLSFFGFIGIVAYCLVNVKGRSPTMTGMRFALGALVINAMLGIILGMLFVGVVLPLPMVLTNLHLTWGLIGWIGLLIISIAYQVVPMFQITPQYPSYLTPWLVPLVFFILFLWTPLDILVHLNQLPATVSQLLIGFIGLGLSIFALVTLNLQAHRLRSIPDVTLNYWRVGMIGLLFSIILWGVGVFWSDLAMKPFYPVLLGVIFIVGFVLPVIQGMLYKIVPFLVWLHLQNQQLEITKVISMVKIPNMKQVIPDKFARRQFWVYIMALGLTISAVLWPAGLSDVAGIVLACSFLFLGYNLYKGLWLYRSVSWQIAAAKGKKSDF